MNLRIGQSKIFVGAKAFRTYETGDEVTLKDQNGTEVEFKVSEITDDDKLVLQRVPETETPTPISPFGSSSIVISADFKDPKTGFKTKLREIVTVTDSAGRSVKLQVDVIVGKDFVVLGLPGKSALSFIHKLKLLWHIGKS